jgi:uncharacterized protein
MNRRQFLKSSALATAAGMSATGLSAAAEALPESKSAPPLRVAVVTGGHPYDVTNFRRLFRELPGLAADVQHLEDFAASPEAVRDGYDVVVFYLMFMDGPSDDKSPWYAGKPKAALARVLAGARGVVLLHHAIMAYPKWDVWSDAVGIANRSNAPEHFSYHLNQTVPLQAAPTHVITRGLGDFSWPDETYQMNGAGAGSDVILTTTHERSMGSIAWTRERKGGGRTFVFQSGHDDQTWREHNFRELLRRGILWSAKRRA